jgi:hypothetical protein
MQSESSGIFNSAPDAVLRELKEVVLVYFFAGRLAIDLSGSCIGKPLVYQLVRVSRRRLAVGVSPPSRSCGAPVSLAFTQLSRTLLLGWADAGGGLRPAGAW